MDTKLSAIDGAIKNVRERITEACRRVGRPESAVRLIGASKGVDIQRIRYAAQYGLSDFGENYIQEARAKITGYDNGICWHMIGYIQANKVKYMPKLFDYVHSIDRWDILEMLDRYEKRIKVLFELNLAGETSKHGTEEDNLRRILEKVDRLKYLEPVGLMTMPPLADDPEEVRGIFRKLKSLLESVNSEFALHMTELSMGMSSDFEVAVEEGATMVRVGTAIFGERV
jgi:PLP dependent protein